MGLALSTPGDKECHEQGPSSGRHAEGRVHSHLRRQARRSGTSAGPHFGGWEIYHLKGSPVDPNRIYASQTSGWFGQIIQRSDDGGKTWHQPGTPAGEPTTTPDGMPKGESNKFVYDTSAETGKPLTTHQWYDGTQHPWEFKRVWHLEPSLTDPDTVYAGVEDAALFRSTDGGKNWHELAGLRGHGTGRKWAPGAGGMGLHTILLDPTNPKRIYIAISAAGAFRTDDGGKTWKPINRGLESQVHSRPRRRGRPLRPSHRACTRRGRTRCSCRSTGTSCAPTTPARTGTKISGNLPTDFGFPIDVHAHEPETIYVVPIKSDSRALSARRQAPRLPQQDRRQRMGAADQRPAAGELLRQRSARRDVRRHARLLRHLFRHDRRAGLLLARRRRQLERRSSTICRRWFRWKCRH